MMQTEGSGGEHPGSPADSQAFPSFLKCIAPWKGCARRSFALVQPSPKGGKTNAHVRGSDLRPTAEAAGPGQKRGAGLPAPCRRHPDGRACSAQDGGPGDLLWHPGKRESEGLRGAWRRNCGHTRVVIVRAGRAALAPHAHERGSLLTHHRREGTAQTSCTECPGRPIAGKGQVPKSGDAVAGVAGEAGGGSVHKLRPEYEGPDSARPQAGHLSPRGHSLSAE